MKLLIAGSRSITSYRRVLYGINQGLDAARVMVPEIEEEVSGHARGVDLLGESWAEERNIPIKIFPASWNLYGNSAGYVRNLEMAEYLSKAARRLVLVLWDGKSRGSQNMHEIAVARKINSLLIKV